MSPSAALHLLMRDMRLHWAALILPAGIALASSFAMHADGENPMTLTGFSLFIAFLIPHTLHLREEHFHTLGDLRALPVTPRDVVALRVLEGLLAALTVILLHAVVSLTLRGPAAFAGWQEWLGPGWLWMVLLILCMPLPVTLRWGGKGWIASVIGLFVLLGALAALGNRPEAGAFSKWAVEHIMRTEAYCSRHPWHHGMALTLACALCLPVAEFAYRRKDA